MCIGWLEVSYHRNLSSLNIHLHRHILMLKNIWLKYPMVILCVHLTELVDAQVAGKTAFLSVSVMVFLEDSIVWISRLSKEYLPLPLQASICLMRTGKWRNGEPSLSLSLYTHLLPFFDIQFPSSQANLSNLLDSLDYRWHIMGFLKPHEHLCQFP